MKNHENGKNLTKPIEAISIFPLAKSQNQVNLKNPSYKTISFKDLLIEKILFTKRIEAKISSLLVNGRDKRVGSGKMGGETVNCEP